MLADFATTCRADEEIITEELKRRGLAVRVHAHSKPLDAPWPQPAGPAANYRRCGAWNCSAASQPVYTIRVRPPEAEWTEPTPVVSMIP
jgi:hypothetical protein